MRELNSKSKRKRIKEEILENINDKLVFLIIVVAGDDDSGRLAFINRYITNRYITDRLLNWNSYNCSQEKDILYKAGMSKRYDFEVHTDDLINSFDQTGLLDNPVGETLKTGLEVAGRLGLIDRHYLKWRVEVKLEARGIDIVNSKEIYITNLDIAGSIF